VDPVDPDPDPQHCLIPKTKKYCSLLRITQDSLLRITQDEEILYMAGNYQIPMRKKYWTWLGIT
jgi:hypothetical protein